MSVRIPKRLKLRPKFRGLPIPYIALIDDQGKPDFRVTDERKRIDIMRRRCCQLCGDSLGKYFFFVGGTEAAKANAYFEPACHLDCLMYAMQVCPFIAGKLEHVDLNKVQADYNDQLKGDTVKLARIAGGIDIKADSTFTVKKNPYWVIKKAQGWKCVKTADETILLQPLGILKVTPPIHAETMTGAAWSKVMEWLSK
jgi:hypothetical protein